MRVCFITNQIAAWGKIGGFGTNTRRLGRALVASGIEVHVVVPRRPKQGSVEHLDGMTVHGQSSWETFFGRKLYRDIDADIYHMEEPTIAGRRAQQAMPGRIHVVTSMDPRERADWWLEVKNATWSRRLKYPIQRYYEIGRAVRRAVRAADGVYVEAEFLREKTQRLFELSELPSVLPKPVPIPEGPFDKAERPLCVFLGRFDPRKRPEMFFQLAARMPDVDFVAIGRAHDARYQRYLEQRHFNQANLTVTGFINSFEGDTLERILRRAWVLVHPAVREGLPTAFQEASTYEMGILAYVDPGEYVSRFGRVVPDDGHLETLENSLRGLLDSGEWRERGKAGRVYNEEHHSIPISVEAHLETYRHHLALGG